MAAAVLEGEKERRLLRASRLLLLGFNGVVLALGAALALMSAFLYVSHWQRFFETRVLALAGSVAGAVTFIAWFGLQAGRADAPPRLLRSYAALLALGLAAEVTGGALLLDFLGGGEETTQTAHMRAKVAFTFSQNECAISNPSASLAELQVACRSHGAEWFASFVNANCVLAPVVPATAQSAAVFRQAEVGALAACTAAHDPGGANQGASVYCACRAALREVTERFARPAAALLFSASGVSIAVCALLLHARRQADRLQAALARREAARGARRAGGAGASSDSDGSSGGDSDGDSDGGGEGGSEGALAQALQLLHSAPPEAEGGGGAAEFGFGAAGAKAVARAKEHAVAAKRAAARRQWLRLRRLLLRVFAAALFGTGGALVGLAAFVLGSHFARFFSGTVLGLALACGVVLLLVAFMAWQAGGAAPPALPARDEKEEGAVGGLDAAAAAAAAAAAGDGKENDAKFLRNFAAVLTVTAGALSAGSVSLLGFLANKDHAESSHTEFTRLAIAATFESYGCAIAQDASAAGLVGVRIACTGETAGEAAWFVSFVHERCAPPYAQGVAAAAAAVQTAGYTQAQQQCIALHATAGATQATVDGSTTYCACRDALMQQMVAFVGPLAGLLVAASVVAFGLVAATLGMQVADQRADLRRLKTEEMQRHVSKTLRQRQFDAEMPWHAVSGGAEGARFELQDDGKIMCVRTSGQEVAF
jgi:hypothetical protein